MWYYLKKWSGNTAKDKMAANSPETPELRKARRLDPQSRSLSVVSLYKGAQVSITLQFDSTRHLHVHGLHTHKTQPHSSAKRTRSV
ncbi:hypothetical protein E2C01_016654 [Portunus trituberculatus]|uniref:Uncharacterized protein n=1 Tax=Portunus trituberculatus TaxID=210409 RepID=A0A5B7DR42_PORTR|nr:hypothetical protein [Portunus trituberculatus]